MAGGAPPTTRPRLRRLTKSTHIWPNIERIAAMFDTPATFAQRYSEPLIITPQRLYP